VIEAYLATSNCVALRDGGTLALRVVWIGADLVPQLVDCAQPISAVVIL
jgi:hypothetical protein